MQVPKVGIDDSGWTPDVAFCSLVAGQTLLRTDFMGAILHLNSRGSPSPSDLHPWLPFFSLFPPPPTLSFSPLIRVTLFFSFPLIFHSLECLYHYRIPLPLSTVYVQSAVVLFCSFAFFSPFLCFFFLSISYVSSFCRCFHHPPPKNIRDVKKKTNIWSLAYIITRVGEQGSPLCLWVNS
jgi:hypothetical protein